MRFPIQTFRSVTNKKADLNHSESSRAGDEILREVFSRGQRSDVPSLPSEKIVEKFFEGEIRKNFSTWFAAKNLAPPARFENQCWLRFREDFCCAGVKRLRGRMVGATTGLPTSAGCSIQ